MHRTLVAAGLAACVFALSACGLGGLTGSKTTTGPAMTAPAPATAASSVKPASSAPATTASTPATGGSMDVSKVNLPETVGAFKRGTVQSSGSSMMATYTAVSKTFAVNVTQLKASVLLTQVDQPKTSGNTTCGLAQGQTQITACVIDKQTYAILVTGMGTTDEATDFATKLSAGLA